MGPLSSAILLTNLICLTMSSLAYGDNTGCRPGHDYSDYYPGNCQKYYSCKDGKKTVESCWWWQKFDENTDQCKWNCWWFCSVDCSKANQPPTVSPPTSGPTTSKPNNTTTQSPNPDNSSTTKKSGTNNSSTTKKSGSNDSSTTKKSGSNTAGQNTVTSAAAILWAISLYATLF